MFQLVHDLLAKQVAGHVWAISDNEGFRHLRSYRQNKPRPTDNGCNAYDFTCSDYFSYYTGTSCTWELEQG